MDFRGGCLVLTSHTEWPGLSPHSASNPNFPLMYTQQMAWVLESLPLMWEIQVQFSTTGIGLAQPLLLEAVGGRDSNRNPLSVSLSPCITLPFNKIKNKGWLYSESICHLWYLAFFFIETWIWVPSAPLPIQVPDNVLWKSEYKIIYS